MKTDLTLSFPRAELLTKVRENRGTHMAEYRLARKAHRKAAIEWLASVRKHLNHTGRLFNRNGTLGNIPPTPEQHEEDYVNAIATLEMAVGDTVELDTETFQRLVRDKGWEWERTFANNTKSYGMSK